MQVAVERVPVDSLVIGVDLDPIRPIRGAIGMQEDITHPKCKAAVRRIMGELGVRALDLVLHDGSPNVGGAWAKEATSSMPKYQCMLSILTSGLLSPRPSNIRTPIMEHQIQRPNPKLPHNPPNSRLAFRMSNILLHPYGSTYGSDRVEVDSDN
ncbi:RNA methyltransferase [Lithospermum erythrorhizon]|uniref:RNA methyltransferase n=1 Tax=Lithospermum erythrorhizon TaxID=34254 RepID=A0AAV3PRG1_LITER